MAKARLAQSRPHHLYELERTDHPHAIRFSTRPTASSRTSDASNGPPRSVLGPLQANLRRLPSSRLRVRVASRSVSMARAPSTNSSTASSTAAADHAAKVGEKRKRASGSENAHAGGRLARGPSRIKRQRSASTQFDSDEEVMGSEMDVDEQPAWPSPQESEDEEAFDSSDEHWINEAQPRQLLRLRKDELVRLFNAAGLAEDTNNLTKPEIVEAIIAARDDFVSLPPSSPPGAIDDNSSEYSSDGGNIAGDESLERAEPDLRALATNNALRRRVTVGELGRAPSRFGKGRSLSLGFLNTSLPQAQPRASGSRRSVSKASTPSESPIDTLSRRKTRKSHSPSGVGSLPSPPITRQRLRQVSTATSSSSSRPSTSKGKGKGKQVEFSASVEKIGAAPQIRSTRSTNSQHADAEESDLTELEELEQEVVDRTPRANKTAPAKLRKTPARKAKGKIGSLREESSASEDDWDEDALGAVEEDEVDELHSSPSPSPPPVEAISLGRKTPVRKRLRPRITTQILTPPSDGDDERDVEELEEDGEEVEGGESDEVMDEDEASEEETEGDETVVEVTPKRLRSGKILGDDDEDEEDEEEDEEEEEGEQDDDANDDAAEEEQVEEEIDVDAEGDEEDDDEAEIEDENVDLTVATTKTLVRLRRDELVRMCETREIEVDGTKPQLAEALLQWRDQQASAPSSTGTARPPSTARPPVRGRRRSSRNSDGQRTPVLLRPHIHVEQPATPPVSSPGRIREGAKEGEDGELELDLESLGLDDREIPIDKLTKLEKIGSGGFKDVFVGKFKSRKVAIAEFRGQLTAMDIKELKLLGGFNHPNIVRFLGVSIPENTKETPVMIVSELCSNGDLFDYVRNVPAPKLSKVLGIMLDIASGLEYLHLRKPSIIHRDCKSSNILISSRVTAKIADFGLAKVKQSTRSMVRSLVGTVNWQAPELWHAHPKYNHKVDVFSCGMVFWEMLQWHVHNKKYPWEGMNEHAIYEAVGTKRQRPSVSGLRKQWCPEIVDLMERMWAQEHQDRPTMSEVVEELQRLVQLYR